MAVTETGVYYPQGGDEFAPHIDIRRQVESLLGRTVTVVLDKAERTAVASLVQATPRSPLYVLRLDAPNNLQVEYTEDSSTWFTVGLPIYAEENVTSSGVDDFEITNGNWELSSIYISRVGIFVQMSFQITYTGSPFAIPSHTDLGNMEIGLVGTRFRPVNGATLPSGGTGRCATFTVDSNGEFSLDSIVPGSDIPTGTVWNGGGTWLAADWTP